MATKKIKKVDNKVSISYVLGLFGTDELMDEVLTRVSATEHYLKAAFDGYKDDLLHSDLVDRKALKEEVRFRKTVFKNFNGLTKQLEVLLEKIKRSGPV